MARSAKYWMDKMLTEKATMANLTVYVPDPDNAQTFLDDVKSSSKVGRWRIMFWCVAVCAEAFDVVLDLAILVMESLAAKSRYATIPWWTDTALKFQYGDELVKNNLEYVYAVIDPTKQIVKLAAAEEIEDGINLKVAKLVGEVITPLSTLEKDAITAYANKKKIPGTRVNIISQAGDDLRLYMAVRYNPLVLKPNGESISQPGVFPAETAINTYLKALGTVEFNGSFDLMKVVDFVQAASGCNSAYIISASVRYGLLPFEAVTQKHTPKAGYLVIDAITPLSSTITYTADV